MDKERVKFKLAIFEILVFFVFLFSASFLYLNKLENIPLGLHVDEVLPGYNAYSLLVNGKDEFGLPYPWAMRFFGSYSPPLYTYLTIPSVYSFGLNPFAVRLPSALAGIISVIIFYLLTKELKIFSTRISNFIVTLFFAISPWTVLYARTGHEAYLGFLFILLGIYLLWKGLEKKYFLVLGIIILSISSYVSYTDKYLSWLLIVGFFFVFKKATLNKNTIIFLATGITIGILIQIPNILLINTPAFLVKSNHFYSDQLRSSISTIPTIIPYPIAWIYSFIKLFSEQFLTYLSPKSLFFLPEDDLQRSLPDLSVFYPWMVVPYLLGLYLLFKKASYPPYKLIILLLILSPLAAALVNQPFSTYRALPLLLPLMLIIGIGIDKILVSFPKISYPIFIALFLSSLILLYRSYFVFLPQERSKVWGWGYSQLASEIAKFPNENIVVDNARIPDPGYLISLAFFLKTSPEVVQASVKPNFINSYYQDLNYQPNSFQNITFRPIAWTTDICQKQIIVADPLGISTEQTKQIYLTKIFEVNDPQGKNLFNGFRTNPEKSCIKINPKGLQI